MTFLTPFTYMVTASMSYTLSMERIMIMEFSVRTQETSDEKIYVAHGPMELLQTLADMQQMEGSTAQPFAKTR